MADIQARKAAILSRIGEIKAEKIDAVSARSAAEAVRDEMRADLMTVLGRITALKTIWALMPQSIRDVIGKYTDAKPL